MRLLVIEDEVDLADSLGRGLTAEGYVVDVVYDGIAGYEFARTGAYSIIVLDLMLPGRSGYEICRRIRAAGVTASILVLTARDGVYEHAEALDSGADDFLPKPFAYPVLLAHLRAIERRQTSQLRAELAIGDLSLDSGRRRCVRAGRTIELSRREFTLLELLMRADGAVVSKDSLLLAWPGEAEDVNLVEARISSLRRKIDRPFARSSLVTVRGIGYRLVDDRPPERRKSDEA